jgi:hypothetical protein
VQRILNEAAAKRPQMGLFDSSSFGPAPPTDHAADAIPAQRGMAPLSMIAAASRVTNIDSSPIGIGSAAQALGQAAYESIDEKVSDLFAPNAASTKTGPRPTPIPVPYGELTRATTMRIATGTRGPANR